MTRENSAQILCNLLHATKFSFVHCVSTAVLFTRQVFQFDSSGCELLLFGLKFTWTDSGERNMGEDVKGGMPEEMPSIPLARVFLIG